MLFREIRTIRMGSRVGTDILSVREVSSDLGGAPSYGFAITLLSLRDISPIRGIYVAPTGGRTTVGFVQKSNRARAGVETRPYG